MTGRAFPLLLAIAALAVPAPAAAHQAHCDRPAPDDFKGDRLRLVKLGQFAAATALAAPDGHRRLYVVERRGRVRMLQEGKILKEPFLDLSSEISPTVSDVLNERGMVSIAFDPGYPETRRVYVGYSDADGDFRVDSFRVSPGGRHALMDTRRPLLHVEHTASAQHYAGQLAFGPDHLLYVSLGDAETRERARKKGLYGKVVRLDPKHPAKLTAIATGLRNPYRFSFDPATGDLVLADVGEDAYDEVDVIPVGHKGLVDFGWPVFEGPAREQPGEVPRYLAPVLSLPHPYVSAVVGGFVMRGPRLPAFKGRYVFGDFCDGWIATSRLTPKAHDTRSEGLTLPYLTAFGQDPEGRLYTVTLAGGVFAVRSR